MLFKKAANFSKNKKVQKAETQQIVVASLLRCVLLHLRLEKWVDGQELHRVKVLKADPFRRREAHSLQVFGNAVLVHCVLAAHHQAGEHHHRLVSQRVFRA